MVILGLDVGDKTIGVAVSDELQCIAQGLKIIKRISIKGDMAQLKEIIESYSVDQIVAGLPKNLDGSIGAQAQKVLAFVEKLKQELKLPVTTWDERFSTQEAKRTLEEAGLNWRKSRLVEDKVAASLILQGYLDYLKHKVKENVSICKKKPV
jgi:putative Holliday junction resolvase